MGGCCCSHWRNCNQHVDVEEKMDPVNKKELKGKFKDRDDKDIDNDGDVDSSDEYLHKRRKAISKNVKGETAKMNPKLDSGKVKVVKWNKKK